LIFPPSPSTPEVTKALCRPHGAYAAQITSQKDNDWITDFATRQVQASGRKPPIVILGAKSESAGTLSWDPTEDGSSCPLTFTNWAPGEPNGDFGALQLYLEPPANKGKWNDISATAASDYPTVCVKAARGADRNVVSCAYKPPAKNPCQCGCECNNCCNSACRRCGCGC